MKFEEWWEKKAPIINNALKNNHDYIKPFFENAYMWGKAVGEKEAGELHNKTLQRTPLAFACMGVAVHDCNDHIVGESPNYYCGICGQSIR